MNIGQLITKGKIDIDESDEDIKFRLAVTAEWDNIIESLNKL